MLTASMTSQEQPGRKKPVIATGILGMLIALAMDIMFFSSLISAYLITRSTEIEWPPWGQPLLPVSETGFATILLLISPWTLFRAHKNCLSKDVKNTQKMLAVSVGLGALFILFQSYEWFQLINTGLTLVSSRYGGTFYLITGIHALHILGGLCVLTDLYFKLNQPDFEITGNELVVPQMWWFFSVSIWPILYAILYF